MSGSLPKFSLVESDGGIGDSIIKRNMGIQFIEAILQVDMTSPETVIDCVDIIKNDFVGSQDTEKQVSKLDASFWNQVECAVLGEIDEEQIIEEATEMTTKSTCVITRLFELHLDWR